MYAFTPGATLLGLIIGFVFFEWPWRGLVIAFFLVIDIAEIIIWLRWRKKKSITGAESVVGERGVAITDCKPDGQVKVRGQIWKATCPGGVAAGLEVIVDEIDSIKLVVSSIEEAEESAPPPDKRHPLACAVDGPLAHQVEHRTFNPAGRVRVPGGPLERAHSATRCETPAERASA